MALVWLLLLCLHALLLLARAPGLGSLPSGPHAEHEERTHELLARFDALERAASLNRPPVPAEAAGRHSALQQMLDRLSSQRGYYAQEPAGPALPIAMSPPELSFGSQPVCAPAAAEVVVTNRASVPVDLMAFTSPDRRFLIADFSPGLLGAGDSVKFSVVFLPADAREFQSTLVLTTSMGHFFVQVVGWGTENPLGLKPMTGAYLPVGGTFEDRLVVHNPFKDTEIRIKDVFATEPDVELEPDRELVKSGWVVKPMHTAHVAAVRKRNLEVGTHAAFVQMRTSSGNFVVPVEFKVAEGGLRVDPHRLDLGSVPSPPDVKTVTLTLENMGTEYVQIVKIVADPPDPFLKWSVSPQSKTMRPREHGFLLTFSYGRRYAPQHHGFVTIVTNATEHAHTLLPVHYPVDETLKAIGYDMNETNILLPKKNTQSLDYFFHSVKLTNKLAHSMEVLSVDADCKNYVEVLTSPSGLVAGPSESWPPVLLKVQSARLSTLGATALPFECALLVNTLASNFRIPLTVYDGHITVTVNGVNATLRSDAAMLPAIQVLHGEKQVLKLLITNPNPVAMKVKLELDLKEQMFVCNDSGNSRSSTTHTTAGCDYSSGRRTTIVELPATRSKNIQLAALPPFSRGQKRTISLTTKHGTRKIVVSFDVLEGGIQLSLPRSARYIAATKQVVPLLATSTLGRDLPVDGILVQHALVRSGDLAPFIPAYAKDFQVASLVLQFCKWGDSLWQCVTGMPGRAVEAPPPPGTAEPRTPQQQIELYVSNVTVTITTRAGAVTTNIADIPVHLPPLHPVSVKIPDVVSIGRQYEFYLEVRNGYARAIQTALASCGADAEDPASLPSDAKDTPAPVAVPAIIDDGEVLAASQGLLVRVIKSATRTRQWDTTRSDAPFVCKYATNKAVLLPVGTKTMLGPIIFSPPIDATYSSTFKVYSNFTGLQLFNIIAEAREPSVSLTIHSMNKHVVAGGKASAARRSRLAFSQNTSAILTLRIENSGKQPATVRDLSAVQLVGPHASEEVGCQAPAGDASSSTSGGGVTSSTTSPSGALRMMCGVWPIVVAPYQQRDIFLEIVPSCDQPVARWHFEAELQSGDVAEHELQLQLEGDFARECKIQSTTTESTPWTQVASVTVALSLVGFGIIMSQRRSWSAKLGDGKDGQAQRGLSSGNDAWYDELSAHRPRRVPSKQSAGSGHHQTKSAKPSRTRARTADGDDVHAKHGLERRKKRVHKKPDAQSELPHPRKQRAATSEQIASATGAVRRPPRSPQRGSEVAGRHDDVSQASASELAVMEPRVDTGLGSRDESIVARSTTGSTSADDTASSDIAQEALFERSSEPVVYIAVDAHEQTADATVSTASSKEEHATDGEGEGGEEDEVNPRDEEQAKEMEEEHNREGEKADKEVAADVSETEEEAQARTTQTERASINKAIAPPVAAVVVAAAAQPDPLESSSFFSRFGWGDFPGLDLSGAGISFDAFERPSPPSLGESGAADPALARLGELARSAALQQGSLFSNSLFASPNPSFGGHAGSEFDLAPGPAETPTYVGASNAFELGYTPFHTPREETDPILGWQDWLQPAQVSPPPGLTGASTPERHSDPGVRPSSIFPGPGLFADAARDDDSFDEQLRRRA